MGQESESATCHSLDNGGMTRSTGHHFNIPGHSLANFKVLVREKVKKNDTLYRKERKHYLIKKIDTFRNGINRKP